MTYQRYFPSIVKTEEFMGFDATPQYNEFDRIEEALCRHHGVWTYECGPDDVEYVRRLKGRVPMYFHVRGDTREQAIASTKELLASL